MRRVRQTLSCLRTRLPSKRWQRPSMEFQKERLEWCREKAVLGQVAPSKRSFHRIQPPFRPTREVAAAVLRNRPDSFDCRDTNNRIKAAQDCSLIDPGENPVPAPPLHRMHGCGVPRLVENTRAGYEFHNDESNTRGESLMMVDAGSLSVVFAVVGSCVLLTVLWGKPASIQPRPVRIKRDHRQRARDSR